MFVHVKPDRTLANQNYSKPDREKMRNLLSLTSHVWVSWKYFTEAMLIATDISSFVTNIIRFKST